MALLVYKTFVSFILSTVVLPLRSEKLKVQLLSFINFPLLIKFPFSTLKLALKSMLRLQSAPHKVKGSSARGGQAVVFALEKPLKIHICHICHTCHIRTVACNICATKCNPFCFFLAFFFRSALINIHSAYFRVSQFCIWLHRQSTPNSAHAHKHTCICLQIFSIGDGLACNMQ